MVELVDYYLEPSHVDPPHLSDSEKDVNDDDGGGGGGGGGGDLVLAREDEMRKQYQQLNSYCHVH